MTSIQTIKKYTLLTSISFFILSLVNKAYCTEGACSDSIMVLLLGWLGMFSDPACWPWLANPCIFLSWWLIKRDSRFTPMVIMASCLLTLSFLIFGQITDTEAGHQRRILSYGLGYYLWLMSAWILLVGYLWINRNQTRINYYGLNSNNDAL